MNSDSNNFITILVARWSQPIVRGRWFSLAILINILIYYVIVRIISCSISVITATINGFN